MKTDEKIKRLTTAIDDLAVMLGDALRAKRNAKGTNLSECANKAFCAISSLCYRAEKELSALRKKEEKNKSQPIWNIADGAGGLVCSGLTYYDAVARYETHLESDPTNSQEWEIFCGDEECEK